MPGGKRRLRVNPKQMSGISDVEVAIPGVRDSARVAALSRQIELTGDPAVGRVDPEHPARSAILPGVAALIRGDPEKTLADRHALRDPAVGQARRPDALADRGSVGNVGQRASGVRRRLTKHVRGRRRGENRAQDE